MGKPDKKLKKILCFIGITGAVYGTFRYLLPLVVPFLLAWGLAELTAPSARRICAKCRITIPERRVRLFGKTFLRKSRTVAVPPAFVGVAEVLLVSALLGMGLYAGGRRLVLEAGLLMQELPYWVERLDLFLTGICRHIETGFGLRDGLFTALMREMLKALLVRLKTTAMPYLMVNSVSLFRFGIRLLVESVLVLAATGMALQELDMWKKRCRRSQFWEEMELIAGRLALTLNAYGKTQGIIMLLTSLLCTLTFWLMKNPYFVLLGVSVGILDALPVLGTGTVLLPWALLLLLQRQWRQALLLFGLYLVCYVLREVLEARLMAKEVGLSQLEMLLSMYVGLRLFGIAGFLLGPVGLLLIRDLTEAFAVSIIDE